MREKVSSSMPGTIQDVSENAVAENEGFGESEPDENTYYSEIMEFLQLEAGSNVKHINEWAASKWGDNGAKWLGIIRKRACHYCLLDGILHHGRENPKPVIIQKSEQHKILQELHVQEHTGIHIGISKMYTALCAAYFWRGQYGDVKNFVRNCGNCVELPSNTLESSYLPILNSSMGVISDSLSSKGPVFSDVRDTQQSGHLGKYKRNVENRSSNKNFEMMDDTEIWKKVEINLLGPYQRAGQGNQYLVVLADPVSHWLSAQALAMDASFEDISESSAAFAFSTFCTFGFPNVCSVVEESGLKVEIMWPTVESMMKPIKFTMAQMNGKLCKTITYKDNSKQSKTSPPTLLSLAGISLEQESQTLPPIVLQLTSTSSCTWAWELMKKYVSENGDVWDVGLDAFLFEERSRRMTSMTKSPFYRMFGRVPFLSENSMNIPQEKEIKSKRRKLRSSIFECRHCQESFTSKISFHIHQKKHTEEAQMRGLIDEETNEEDLGHISSSEISNPIENVSQKLLPNNPNVTVVEDVSLSTPTPCKKSIHRRTMPVASNRRKPQVKIGGGKKQYQRGITRLLTLAQVSRSLAVRGACEEIPRDSRRASFTAQTVASVRASLEAKRNKHTCRGNYQRYSPELREEIAKYALCHGTQQAVCHYSNSLGGKAISESTVRNFIKAHCSPTGHLNHFRNQDLEEEIGRFSALAGTEAAVRYFSSRLGREIKRGTVSRFRRAYLNKHPEDVGISKVVGKKKNESTRRKRRFGALLRDEIGNYAAQHGVSAAVQHFSEKLLFPVRERTITKFLKMYMEKETPKNALVSAAPHPVSGLLDKPACMPTHANQSIDILNSSLDVLGSLQQNNEIDRIDQGNSVSQLMYSEDAYAGLQHTLQHQQQASDSINTVAFHDSGPTGYNDDQHSANQVILDQGIPVSFCGSQDLNFHPVPNYPNFEHPGMQVSINSMGVVQSSESVNMAIQSGQQDGSVTNVPMSHVLSQHNPMIVSHHSLMDSSNLQNNHQRVVMPQEEARSEQVSSQNGQVLNSNHSATLTALLPSSSFDHTKNQVISSSLINQSTESTVPLNDTAISSLQKSIVRGIDASYYPLTMTTSQSFQVEDNNVNDPMQNSMMNKTHANAVALNQQPLLLGEELLPVTLENDRVTEKCNLKEVQAATVECNKSRCLNDISHPERVERTCLMMNREMSEENMSKNDTSGGDKGLNVKKVHEVNTTNMESSKGKTGKKKSLQGKKSKKKCVQKPKRGNYTFYSPELRARIGRYAAEHGNLQASKHFRSEVGHQIPESTIRGLRDKYVVKQMQVAATAVSSGSCADSQRQVTALGYAPRGRPMRLGKYDEIVQDCMHELVNSGEKVCSMLAITTARQVLTQYEPSLLEEFGGSVKLNNSWAKSFIKRMGLSNNS